MISWGGYFFFNPSSFLMELIISIHDYVILFLIRILFLVIYKIFFLIKVEGFNVNFFENHQIEFIWTFLPFAILLIIISPSLYSLYIIDSCMFCGIPIFIIGHQWYWRYFYPDFGSFFDSYIAQNVETGLRLIEVDNSFIVPFVVPIRCILSSSDVIHSWTIPSLGVKIDAIPGRINNFCFSIKRPGIFFGQCSEICGVNHRFIPIRLESIDLEDFFSAF